MKCALRNFRQVHRTRWRRGSSGDCKKPATTSGTALSILARHFWDSDGGWLPLGVSGASGPYAPTGNRQRSNNCANCVPNADCWLPLTSLPSTAMRTASATWSAPATLTAPRFAKDLAPSAALAGQVQTVLDAFVRENKWQRRQQEIVRPARPRRRGVLAAVRRPPGLHASTFRRTRPGCHADRQGRIRPLASAC